MLRKINLIILSAGLLILSFPPFNIWIFAWVSFIPLLFALEDQKPLKSFFISYLAGFLFFLGTIYWLIHVTLPGMLVVVAYLALYFGLFGLILSCVWQGDDNKRLILIPASWVALEWMRTNALTGFGWNLLGYSQSYNLPIIQIADITGAYGVGFLILMFNAALYIFVKNIRSAQKRHIPLVITASLLLIISGYGIFRLNNIFTGERLKVAVVQGNIPQDEKWDRRFTDMIMSRYRDLTKEAASSEKIDLVIWPETSVPGFIQNEKELFDIVYNLSMDIAAPILVGAPRYDDKSQDDSYYNSAFLFLKDGSVDGHYDKTHLVPFGEYVPLKNLLSFVHRFAPRPIGDCAAGKDFTVFKFLLERSIKDEGYSWKLSKKVSFSCLICFEDIFPDIARRFAGKNIDFLVNITNDAWFGRSSAAYQHAQASVFRAVENRINVLRSANTGLSCFIDQKGRVTARVMGDGKDLFVSGFKAHEIILSRTRTLYTVYGDLFAYICIFLTVFSITRCLRENSRRSS
ncbi:MAG: apolipoprotein N-acyltransferase [Candidatus Omnitrophota bacterium]|nr:apolipoprotein N-acyltransferase [Candidatus Omnitrophota bacterium]